MVPSTPKVQVWRHTTIACSKLFSYLAFRLVEFWPKVVVFGSLSLLKSSGMSSSIVLLCNPRSFITNLSYSYLYSHDLYPAVSDIYFMISLQCYYMLCMIRQLALVHWYPFQYSKVCSSMMSIHQKGGGSARDTRVLLTNVDMVSRLVKCCWTSPFLTVCRGSLQVVTTLFCAIVILHIRLPIVLY